ncbi:hypothetical protein Hypma_007132 [Hypsizygus marmoreus]|uniref:Uncharacterized protein n=1 Tax=Hypsizygus marmoreus TaxID=39966 RepID=A0A369K8P8_HYPMA|nr:hypothetical protein Hypma_007132 [Hypsizygus marmoreus]
MSIPLSFANCSTSPSSRFITATTLVQLWSLTMASTNQILTQLAYSSAFNFGCEKIDIPPYLYSSEDAARLLQKVRQQQVACNQAKAAADTLVEHCSTMADTADRNAYEAALQVSRVVCLLRACGFNAPEEGPSRIPANVKIKRAKRIIHVTGHHHLGVVLD